MKSIKKTYAGYLYILPSFLLILIFSMIPIGMTLYFSFTKYNVMQPPVFVGLKNYLRMFNDPFLLTSIQNTFVYTIIVVPAQTILSLLIANVLAKSTLKKFSGFIRSSLFVPVISSMILVGTVWKILLSTDNGIINYLLNGIGISNINWLGGKATALISVCIVSVWKNVGYFLVIYYAGIMDISTTYYEAAEVDGATAWQQLRYITIPCLKPVTFLVITLGTIWSFQVFDLVYAMTGGGPGTATTTMVLSIYQTAFKQYNMGYASAVSTLLFAIIILVSFVQKKFFKEEM